MANPIYRPKPGDCWRCKCAHRPEKCPQRQGAYNPPMRTWR